VRPEQLKCADVMCVMCVVCVVCVMRAALLAASSGRSHGLSEELD